MTRLCSFPARPYPRRCGTRGTVPRLRASILRNDRAGAFEHDSILLTDHRRMLAKIGRAVRAQTPDASGSDRYGEADRFTVLIEQRDRDVRRLVGDIRKDD